MSQSFLQSSVGNSFQISLINNKEFSFPINLRIHKDQHRIVFKSLTDYSIPTLGYVASQEVTSSRNLSILDRSDSVEENQFTTSSSTVLFTGLSFLTQTKEFSVTDIFTDSDATTSREPLFYAHSVSQHDSDLTTVLSIQVLDSGLREVDTRDSVIDLSRGKIYNNLFNITSEIISPYYVRYTLKEISSGKVRTYTELLSNQSVFHLATFDDLDPDTGNLLGDSQAYFLDEQASGSFQITLPRSNQYGILEIFASKIRLASPSSEVDLDNPWFVSVTNGKFTRNAKQYYLSEFEGQLFNPYPPIKFVQQDIAEWIGPNLIKLSYRDVTQSDSEDLHLTVKVYTKDEWESDSPEPRLAFTTDSDLVGDTVVEDVLWEDAIRSIDSLTGLVDLSTSVRDDDVVVCDYYYRADKLEYVDVDFNPQFNLSASNNTRWILFLVPDVDQGSKSIYHLTVNRSGIVTYSNWDDPDDSTLQDAITAGTQTYASFKSTYTTEASSGDQVLVLGEVSIGDTTSEQELSLLDMRVPGGGLREGHLDDAVRENPLALAYSDISAPYPGMSTYVVSVPRSTLTDFGGKLTKDEVKSITYRHVALGSYPVIRYYGDDPVFTKLATKPGKVVNMTWTDEGTSTTYSLHFAEDKATLDENLTVSLSDDSTLIESGLTSESYNLDGDDIGLVADKRYWFRIKAFDTNSNIIGVSDAYHVRIEG